MVYSETMMRGAGVMVFPSDDTGAIATAVMRGVLVENNEYLGIYAADGAMLEITSSRIHGTKPNQQGDAAAGVQLYGGKLWLKNSVVDENLRNNVAIEGGDATIHASIVRNTQPMSQEIAGMGIAVITNSEGDRGTATIWRSELKENTGIGLFGDCANLTLDASVVRDTQLDQGGHDGRGINIQSTLEGEPSTASIRDSLIEDNRDIGVYMSDSNLSVEKTIVRGTKPTYDDSQKLRFGDGIAVMRESRPTNATLTDLYVENNARFNISNFGAVVNLYSSTLLCGGKGDGNDNVSTQGTQEFPGYFGIGETNHCGCPEATKPCVMCRGCQPLEEPPGLPEYVGNGPAKP